MLFQRFFCSECKIARNSRHNCVVFVMLRRGVCFSQNENVIFDGSCQHDNMQFVQLQRNHIISDEQTGTFASMRGWNSSRDLAFVDPAQTVTISEMQITIFSAVPVFGPDDNYIALLTEKDGDIWQDPISWQHSKDDRDWWKHGNLDRNLYFCTGPNRSHLTQIVFRGSLLMCPWPPEESDHKMFEIFLEDWTLPINMFICKCFWNQHE